MVMKRIRKIRIGILICLLGAMLFPYGIMAHSGNTDSYGGHNKRSNGSYHCHSGQCLEDARQSTYEYYFPFGQKDGLTGTDSTEKIRGWLYSNFDSDQAEYIVPYAFEAYNAGYEDTYVPTLREKFWDKYGVAISLILVVLVFFVGWMLLGFILLVFEYFWEKLLLNKKKPPIPP